MSKKLSYYLSYICIFLFTFTVLYHCFGITSDIIPSLPFVVFISSCHLTALIIVELISDYTDLIYQREIVIYRMIGKRTRTFRLRGTTGITLMLDFEDEHNNIITFQGNQEQYYVLIEGETYKLEIRRLRILKYDLILSW